MTEKSTGLALGIISLKLRMINFTNNQDSKYPEKLIKGLRMEMGHKNERV